MRLLRPGASYEELRSEFRHRVQERFNMGTDALDHQQSDALALIYEESGGSVRRYTFGELVRLSNQLANAFGAIGVEGGDRVGILLGQRPETALTHVTLYRMGAIALPLFTQFGTDALTWRLSNSEAKAIVTDGTQPSQGRSFARLDNQREFSLPHGGVSFRWIIPWIGSRYAFPLHCGLW